MSFTTVTRMFTITSSAASSPPSPPISQSARPSNLPVRSIPGSYGLPLVGPLSDRMDYFWFQGPDKFFKTRIEKHDSTVFRTNMPPTFPFFWDVNPNVVAVLDCASFAHMFDMELVEKRNILVGDFMPSVQFTGGVRVCAYLDTAEPKHAKIKNFAMDILKRSSKSWTTNLTTELDAMWDSIESTLSGNTSAGYVVPLQQFLFKFLTKSLLGADPASNPEIAKSGYSMLDTWLGLQILPTVSINVIQPLEEIFLHSFPYPFALVSSSYNKLAKFVETQCVEVLERGQAEFGLTKQEAIHNLLFILGFNAFGGFSVFFPSLISTIANDSKLQERLRKEVKENTGGSSLSFESLTRLDLVKSVVYETLRLNPPVPLQYARARKDFELRSHDSTYQIKKGELLCGYQKIVMRDSKVFDDPETFNPERFMGDEGRDLLNYLYWSNGPQTGTSSELNKQCAAKDIVCMTACLFVAHLFTRYENVTFDSTSVTAVVKAK
ncbi:unnamed protein product [Rhodiola kirilowii]